MKIRDGCLFLKNEGRQLNFIMILGVVSLALYFYANRLGEFTDSVTIPLMKGATLFLALFYLAYSVILMERVNKHHYGK